MKEHQNRIDKCNYKKDTNKLCGVCVCACVCVCCWVFFWLRDNLLTHGKQHETDTSLIIFNSGH